jgi:hypothetical protein
MELEQAGKLEKATADAPTPCHALVGTLQPLATKLVDPSYVKLTHVSAETSGWQNPCIVPANV